MNERIAIIGAGNMGKAIANGLETHGLNTDKLILTNSVTNNNREATAYSDIVILSVKPQRMKNILQEIGNTSDGKLIISVAAGVTMDSIVETLGNNQMQRIVRVMPNLGARVGESMSVWVANEHVTEADKVVVREIFSSIGREREVNDEDLIDVATAISGSGPAYFFYFVEQLSAVGQELGLSEDMARELAEQTLIGAAVTLANTNETARELRLAVTSEGGTTSEATERFQAEMVDLGFRQGVRDAHRRARELRIS